MDLLELNKRGMDGVAEDEEWMEGDSGYQFRNSRQTELEENKVSL